MCGSLDLRCGDADTPSTCQVEAYEAAVEALLRAGLTPAPFLPEMRAMWRRGKHQRDIVRSITSSWEVAA
jgi:hypothetical protein